MTTNLTPKALGLQAELEAWLAQLSIMKDRHQATLTQDEVNDLLDCVMRVQGFISYANRENRRLVRERDRALDTVEDLVEHSAGESV
jgi:hypothetical protein